MTNGKPTVTDVWKLVTEQSACLGGITEKLSGIGRSLKRVDKKLNNDHTRLTALEHVNQQNIGARKFSKFAGGLISGLVGVLGGILGILGYFGLIGAIKAG